MKTATKPLNYYEISSFCRQMARLFAAGIGPMEALSIVKEDTTDSYYNSFLTQMSENVEHGMRFHEALEETHMFPDYVVSLMRLGEETGRLDTVADSLASYYEKEDTLRQNIKSAVLYPVIMVGLMLIVVMVVLRFVLPVFQQVFEEMGSSMSGISGALLQFGNALSRYSFAINLFLLALLLLILFFALTDKGRSTFRSLLLRFAPTRALQEDIACGRFASGMALALKSGLPTKQSMDLSADIVGNEAIRARILESAGKVEMGFPFVDAIEKAHLFEHFHMRMLEVSSRTGGTDEVMQEIADEYDRRTGRRLSSFLSAIEPTLVIILSVVIGAILLSVIMPLLGVLSDIG